MIPKNNLDDRTFNDIVDEAIRLIPRYCPEWTNHNPTDPGITLIELFAWMTEMTLYRLNRVPEKTYLSLLELMGLSLVPPQSARAVVRFAPVEGTKKTVRVKRGTQIASVSGSDESFVFETERELAVNGIRLESCVNRVGERWEELVSGDAIRPFMLFDAEGAVEHVVYLSSPSFEHLIDGNSARIEFEGVREIASVQDELVNYLYWEYWDGRTWTSLEAQRSLPGAKKKDNVVYLSGPIPLEPTEIAGRAGYFVRGVLAGIPENRNVLSIRNALVRSVFTGRGFIPDLCLQATGSAYAPADMNGAFRLFSENPAYNEAFYIAGDAVFSNAGTRVTVDFTFSEIYVPGSENENARFEYEYWNGNDWVRLDESAHSLRDGTFSFKQQGSVSFVVPGDIERATVNAEERYWIRVRLLTKDFSIGGQYVKDDKDNWVWHFNSRVHSPVIGKLRISYDPKKRHPECLVSETDFRVEDHSSSFDGRGSEDPLDGDLSLFDLRRDDLPSLYFGFSSAFPEGDAAIYVRVDETRSSKPLLSGKGSLDRLLARDLADRRQIDLCWQYWSGEKWEDLSVTDQTDSFHQSGFVEFVAPADSRPRSEFGRELHWVRVILLSGSFESRPRVLDVILNAVYARNEKTYREEIVASGTGAPGQSCVCAHGPILPGLDLLVDEGSVPPANEVDAMRADGITEPYIVDGDSVWVRYREVDDFYSSDAFSRHFMIDYRDNVIHFGDGIRGVNPPRKKFNIKIASYAVGGGAAGNVAARSLRQLTQSIPFIAGCDNPFAAEGGADMETVESLKSRAAGVFKSLERAVTAEDFRWLAREASASVGRAHCLGELNARGEIRVVVIPVMPSGVSHDAKLLPSRELMRRVSSYLEERKLVGTKIKVQPPLYRTFEINLALVFKSDVIDPERSKKGIREGLLEYFHVLDGADGEGWAFGRDISHGSVLKQLERIDGILSVDSAEIFDVDAGVAVEKLTLRDDEVPFLSSIRIENRRESA